MFFDFFKPIFTGWFFAKLILKALKLLIYHQFSNIKLSLFTSHMKSTTLVADPLATLETSIAYCPKRMRTLLNLEYYLKMQILADLSPPVHLQ